MAQSIFDYLAAHPKFFMALGAFIVLLAAFGLWYVITHYLQIILITFLCAGGVGSAIVVIYQGVTHELRDLVGIGVFLILVFPVIFWQAIRLSYAEPPPEPKAAEKPPAARKTAPANL